MPLEDWIIDELVARGGMSEVRAVTHRRLGERAVLKLVRLSPAAEREIRALACVDHPNVVPIFDLGVVASHEADAYGLPADAWWMVLPRLEAAWELPDRWSTLRHLLADVLAGLSAIHGAGLLHLDIKPGNLLHDGRGYVLADLGLATGADRPTDEDVADSGLGWGSLAYMAPERFDRRRELLTVGTDLYAVGCLAWALTAGQPWMQATTWTEASRAHREDAPPPLLPRFPVPPGFEAWLRASLAKEPWHRFRCARAALDGLLALGEAVTSVGSAVSAPAPRRDLAPTVTVPAGEAQPTPWSADVAPCFDGMPDTWAEVPRWHRRMPCAARLLDLVPLRFTGREQARGALWEALRQVHRGHGPRLVRVAGPPGAGRTRLGSELLAQVRANTGAIALAWEAGRSDAALAAGWLGLDPEATDQHVMDAVRVRTGAAAAAPPRTPLGVLRALAAWRTTVLWMDDLHAADWVRGFAAADGLDGARLLVVVAPAGRGETEAFTWRYTTQDLSIDPLSPGRIRATLADWVGLDPAMVADLVYRCEDDLGLAVACLRDAWREGHLVAGRRGLIATSPPGWPATVEDDWSLDPPAGPDVEDAVRVAAAMGRTVDEAAWRRMFDSAAVDAAVDLLTARGMVVREDAGLRWVSPVPRRAWLRRDRAAARDAHRRVEAQLAADGVDGRWRGLQLLQAGDVLEAARLYLPRADVAARRGGMAEVGHVVPIFEEAFTSLALPEADPIWGDLWRAQLYLGPTHRTYEAQWAICERLRERAEGHRDDPEWAAHHRHSLTHVLWLADVQLWPARLTDQEDACRRLMRDGAEPVASIEQLLAWVALRRGRSDEAIGCFERAIANAEAGSLTHLAVQLSLGVAYRHAGRPGVADYFAAVVPRAMDGGLLSAEADGYSAWAAALRDEGRFDEAMQRAQHALRSAAGGEARADPGFAVQWALLLADTGELGTAKRELERQLAGLGDEGPGWEGTLRLHLARVAAEQGDPDAWALAERARADLRRAGLRDPDLDASERALARLAR